MRTIKELKIQFIQLIDEIADRGVSLERMNLLLLSAWPEHRLKEDVNCDITDNSCLDPCCGCKR